MRKLAAAVVGATAISLCAVSTLQPASAAPPPKPTTTSAETPKNIIYVIVDGFGPAQLELGRRMNGGTLNITNRIDWDVETSIDSSSLEGVTDSAAGATALASGAETLNGWVGTVPTSNGGVAAVETVLERAEASGMATGLISDSYITDATPAAFAAHVSDRGENSAIAQQMSEHGIEYIFGGGLRQGSVGPLLAQPGVTIVKNRNDMLKYAASGKAGPVYGLFGSWNMAFNLDRDDEGVTRKEPTLPEMTTAGLDVLSHDSDGFFLMVEQGLVDWAGHARDGGSLGSEMIEGDEVVKAALDWVKAEGIADETLIVLTGDHETGGLVLSPNTNIAALKAQKATTEYMWGAISHGASIASTLKQYTGITATSQEVNTVRNCGEHGISDVLAKRWNLTWNNTCKGEGDHTGTPVPLFALGPGADALQGTFYDNEVVGLTLIDYAS
ncbi:MAG TPA: alkaline phosphatase [Actinomycetes bacterium]|nr:alkaline phosphatase [Actinomycetes bacterium]